MAKTKRPNEGELLKKNPKVASIFRSNKKKLEESGIVVSQKEYSLDLPYGKSPLVPSSESQEMDDTAPVLNYRR